MVRRLHGRRWQDDYLWLRPAGADYGPQRIADLPQEIRSHVERENAHFDEFSRTIERERDAVLDQMQVSFEGDWAPVAAGPYEYWVEYVAGNGALVSFWRRLRAPPHTQETLLGPIDPPTAEDRVLPAFFVDRAHRRFAYGTSREGERYTLRIRDTQTGQDLDDVVPDVALDPDATRPVQVAWLRNGSGLLYVFREPNQRAREVRLHKLGTPAAQDERVFLDPHADASIGLDELDEGFATISVSIGDSTAVWLLRLGEERPRPEFLMRRSDETVNPIYHDGRRVFLFTNKDAPDFRIVTFDADDPRPETWRDVVPHVRGRRLDWAQVSAGRLVTCEWRDAQQTIVLYDLAGGSERVIPPLLPEPHNIESIDLPVFPDGVLVRVSSLRTPPTYFEIMPTSAEARLLARTTVSGALAAVALETTRHHVTGHDGVSVPVTLLHRRDLARDGTAPAILVAYGSFGEPLLPSFEARLFGLAAHGAVIAYAHVRGGGELGWAWHQAARGSNKVNAVLDFISVAGWLIGERYSDAGRIIARGASAGGLLVAAAATMCPDLFSAVFAAVPMVDPLETVLIDSPIVRNWNGEFGKPAHDSAALAALQMMSPYDNARAQCYPAVLMTAAVNDIRVPFWGPLRYAARLRASMAGGGPVFVTVKDNASHASAQDAQTTSEMLAAAMVLSRRRS